MRPVLTLAIVAVFVALVSAGTPASDTVFHEEADYIFVGAGTTGCPAAKRLSEALPQAAILMINDGDDITGQLETDVHFDRLHTEPIAVSRHAMWGNSHEMTYPVGNQNHTFVHRSLALGGSSAFNTMFAGRSPLAYWEAIGDLLGADYKAAGWSAAHFADLWRTFETYTSGTPGLPVGPLHGTNGPVPMQPFEPVTEPTTQLLRQITAAEFGIPILPNENSVADDGVNVGNVPSLSSVARAYSVLPDGTHIRNNSCQMYGVANQPNIVIRSVSVVQRLVYCKINTRQRVFRNGDDVRICGVEYISNTPQETIHRLAYARQEVIVTAGTAGSIHLLHNSGIGDFDYFDKLGARSPVRIYNNPNVGKNITDSLLVQNAYILVHPGVADVHNAGNINMAVVQSDHAKSLGSPWTDYSFINGIIEQTPYGPIWGSGCVQYAGKLNSDSFIRTSHGGDINSILDAQVDLDYTPLVECGIHAGKIFAALPAHGVYPIPLGPFSWTSDPAAMKATIDKLVGLDWHTHGGILLGDSVDAHYNILGVQGGRVCGLPVLPIGLGTHSTFTTATLLGEDCAQKVIADANLNREW